MSLLDLDEEKIIPERQENKSIKLESVSLRTEKNTPAPSEIYPKEKLQELYKTNMYGEELILGTTPKDYNINNDFNSEDLKSLGWVTEDWRSEKFKEIENSVFENPVFSVVVGKNIDGFDKLEKEEKVQFVKDNIGDLTLYSYDLNYGKDDVIMSPRRRLQMKREGISISPDKDGPKIVHDDKRYEIQSAFKNIFEAEVQMKEFLKNLNLSERPSYELMVQETQDIVLDTLRGTQNYRDAMIETKMNLENKCSFPDGESYSKVLDVFSNYTSKLLECKIKMERVVPKIDIDTIPSSMYHAPDIYFSMKQDGLSSVKEVFELVQAFKYAPLERDSYLTTGFESQYHGFVRNDLFNKIISGENLERILVSHTPESETMAAELIEILDKTNGFCYIDLDFTDSNFGTLFEHYRELFPEGLRKLFDNVYLNTYRNDINISKDFLKPEKILKPYGELDHDKKFKYYECSALLANIISACPREDKINWLKNFDYLHTYPDPSRDLKNMDYVLSRQIKKHPDEFQFSTEELREIYSGMGKKLPSVVFNLSQVNLNSEIVPDSNTDLILEEADLCKKTVLGFAKDYGEIALYENSEFLEDMQGLVHFVSSRGQSQIDRDTFCKTILEKSFSENYPAFAASLAYLIPDYGERVESTHTAEELKDYFECKETLEILNENKNLTWRKILNGGGDFVKYNYIDGEITILSGFSKYPRPYEYTDPRTIN